MADTDHCDLCNPPEFPLILTIHTKFIYRLRNVHVGYVLYRALVVIQMSKHFPGLIMSKYGSYIQ